MLTKTPIFRLGCCLVLALCAACGPLVPLSYQKEILNDPLRQTIDTDEATVHLEYVESKYGYYIFDLEVTNYSPSEILVAPQFISYYAAKKPFKSLQYATQDVHTISRPNSELFMKRVFANSPERTQKMYREKMIAKAKSEAFFAGLVGAALVIYDAEKDKEDNKKERLSKKEENESAARDIFVSAALSFADEEIREAREAHAMEYRVPYDLFPEGKIKSGDVIGGKIFLSKESYRYSRIVVPIGNFDYVFDFRRAGTKSIQSRSRHHPSVGAPRK